MARLDAGTGVSDASLPVDGGVDGSATVADANVVGPASDAGSAQSLPPVTDYAKPGSVQDHEASQRGAQQQLHGLQARSARRQWLSCTLPSSSDQASLPDAGSYDAFLTHLRLLTAS
jgi:hypothetical protein